MKTLFAAGITALVSIAIFTPWLIGEQRGTHTSSAVEATHPLTFPDDFDWGVAVAAQHVEHQQPSDWTAFERRVIAESKTGTGDKPGPERPARRQQQGNAMPDTFICAYELSGDGHATPLPQHTPPYPKRDANGAR